jgi:hypothetical protein
VSDSGFVPLFLFLSNQNLNGDLSMNKRFDIVRTSEGFMPYDHDCDEYLYDEKGNNCFDTYEEALRLVEDAIITIQEHHQGE